MPYGICISVKMTKQNHVLAQKHSCAFKRALYNPTPHAKIHCSSKDQKSCGQAVQSNRYGQVAPP
jgi:hypothetical protein